jgi:uroporphyrinogen decarboxylase
MVGEPAFVNGLLDKILEFNLKIINMYLEYDVDCIHFGDDWGQQKGLIMGPVMWRKYIKPRLAEMYGAVKKKGRFISQHSCGDIRQIMPDVIDIGLNIYQTFQPEIYDIYETKEAFGGKLTFWGGISTQRLLPFETPEKVIEKSAEIMRVVGKNGGLIAAPTHSIPGDVPAENMDALIRLFTNQSAYL